MTVMEVWNAAHRSNLTTISEIYYYETDHLPKRVDGMFVRLVAAGDVERAAIYVRKSLPRHRKDFVIIKEMMHCWSPTKTYVSNSGDARKLVLALLDRTSPYTSSAAADTSAILAAAEVILPHYKVEWHQQVGHDHDAIANWHGLHPDVVRMICSMDVLHHRKERRAWMIEGKTLACDLMDVDHYARPVIWCDLPSGADLSCEMIRQGHAEEWWRYSRGAYEDC